jgi:hypothetical protein
MCVATIGDVSPMSRIVMEPSKINVLPAIVLINDASSHVQNVNLKWIYSLNHRAVGFRLGAWMGTIGTTPVLRWETDAIKRPFFFCFEAIVTLLPTLGFVWKGWPAPKPAHG